MQTAADKGEVQEALNTLMALPGMEGYVVINFDGKSSLLLAPLKGPRGSSLLRGGAKSHSVTYTTCLLLRYPRQVLPR